MEGYAERTEVSRGHKLQLRDCLHCSYPNRQNKITSCLLSISEVTLTTPTAQFASSGSDLLAQYVLKTKELLATHIVGEDIRVWLFNTIVT